MRRVVLERTPRSELFEGERLALSAMVVDDMGNDASAAGALLSLSVARLTSPLPRPHAGRGSEPSVFAALIAGACGTQQLSQEEGDWRRELPADSIDDGSLCLATPSQVPLRPKAYGSELCGKTTLQFSEELHDQGAQIAITVSAVSGQADIAAPTLPLTVGPIWLSCGEANRRDRLREGLGYCRQLLHSEMHDLDVVLIEEKGTSATIAGSLWDAGVVLGSYLAHTWRTNRDCLLGSAADSTEGCYADTNLLALELGCGTGCAGLMLAKAVKHQLAQPPGLRVCLTDGDEKALDMAKLNIMANDLSRVACCAALSWGDAESMANLLGSVAGSGSSRMGFVFAADVVYDEIRFYPLVESMYHAAISAFGLCDVILAYRLRTDAKRAEHFWHLVTERFDVQLAVPESTVNDALRAYGIAGESTYHGVSIYHLKPLPGSPRLTSCLYCSRMLTKREEAITGEHVRE